MLMTCPCTKCSDQLYVIYVVANQDIENCRIPIEIILNKKYGDILQWLHRAVGQNTKRKPLKNHIEMQRQPV